MRLQRLPFVLFLIFGLLLAACGGDGDDSAGADDPAASVTAESDAGTGADSGAVEAIERYLQARVDSDEESLYTITCAALEGEIPMQASSFAAVNASLRDMACRLDGSEGEFTLVTCEGVFFIEYGEEQQNSEIPLETYRVLQEDGEWRACGEGGAGIQDPGPTPTPPE